MGFSLLELVIVIVLIGILAMVALPSYSTYVVKANRTDAKDKLTEIMFEQERHHLRQGSYTLNLSVLGFSLDAYQGVPSKKKLYSIVAQPCALAAGLTKCVLLVARPTPGAAQDVAGEVPLQLNSLGEKTGPWN